MKPCSLSAIYQHTYRSSAESLKFIPWKMRSSDWSFIVPWDGCSMRGLVTCLRVVKMSGIELYPKGAKEALGNVSSPVAMLMLALTKLSCVMLVVE